MPVLLVEPPRRRFDLRPRHHRRPAGRCGRRFDYQIEETSRPGTLQNEHEQAVAGALTALGRQFGIEDVGFRIIRTHKHNGKLGWKIPDLRLITAHGTVFIEISTVFSRTELAALQFLRDRYEIEVIEVTGEQATAIAGDHRILGQLIAAAEMRQMLRADNPFLAAITRAALATAARRKQHRKTTKRAAQPSNVQPAIRPDPCRPIGVSAGLQAARLAHALTRRFA